MNVTSLETQKLVTNAENLLLKPILEDLISVVDAINLKDNTQQTINDIITMSGTTAATTTTYMEYAYNVITTASATAYACRLPNPPTKGRSCIIVNTSGFPIVVYPSVTGGSINGVVNGSALIPSDGKPYTFFCYENPLPGAWTWTPPAINQYDSGEITVDCNSNSVVSFYDSSGYGTSTSFQVSSSLALDGLNKSAFFNSSTYRAFKPSPIWNGIKKLKVYTNLLNDAGGASYGLGVSYGANLYELGTTTFYLQSGNISEFPFGAYGSLGSVVTGTPSVGTLSSNIGDAGTYYGELDLSAALLTGGYSFLNSFGDMYAGIFDDSGYDVDKWYSAFINFSFKAGQSLTGLKVRFFIEYN